MTADADEFRVLPGNKAELHPASIRTIDAHTAGEPLRVIVDGVPAPNGATMLERMRFAQSHLDSIRRILLREPRGHTDMYGCLLTEPATPDGHLGVLFMHNAGFSTMCGHGIIGLVKVVLDANLLVIDRDETIVRIDTPAGRISADVQRHSDGRVDGVSFTNVPSFVLERDLEIQVAGIGTVVCDIAFGGAAFAFVDARTLGLALDRNAATQLIDAGRQIKEAIERQHRIAHPSGIDELNTLYGTVFFDVRGNGIHSRHVCVYGDGQVDRSPTGTAVSGRAAILHARGELPLGRQITIDSILGTTFDVLAQSATLIGGLPAVIPVVTGRAHVTGRHEFFIDPRDPLGEGFLLR